jgi:hypothetical protein
MNSAPKWFLPIAVIALLWNLAGCAAYISDALLTAEDIAKLSPTDQALYAARPAWSVAATAIAVWVGALGCLGLILRKRWALYAFVVSLLGVVVQDISIFSLSYAKSALTLTPVILQGLVLIVSIALLLLARRAIRNGWIR